MEEKVLNECIRRMKALKLDKDMVIDRFIEDGDVLVSEYQNKYFKGVLYDVKGYTQAHNLDKAIKEFEKKYNATVYHAIATPFRDFNSRLGVYTISLLFVVNNEEEWKIDYRDIVKRKQVYSYVIGVCDELGYIGVDSWSGGIYRTW